MPINKVPHASGPLFVPTFISFHLHKPEKANLDIFNLGTRRAQYKHIAHIVSFRFAHNVRPSSLPLHRPL